MCINTSVFFIAYVISLKTNWFTVTFYDISVWLGRPSWIWHTGDRELWLASPDNLQDHTVPVPPHTQSVWLTTAAENTGHTEHCTHLQVWWSVLVVIPHIQSVWPTTAAENTGHTEHWTHLQVWWWLLVVIPPHTISMAYCWKYWTHRTLYSSTSLMVSIGCNSTHTISMAYCSCWEYWTHRT